MWDLWDGVGLVHVFPTLTEMAVQAHLQSYNHSSDLIWI